MEFNMIVTCGRFMEFNAMRELENIFYLIGDEDAKFRESRVKGIIFVNTNLDPHEAIGKIRLLIEDRPWEFRFTKRYIPVDRVVNSSLERIREAALDLAVGIPKGSSYRITVEKRHSDLHTMDLIGAIAPSIDRKVSLKNPDYVLLIEIVGEVAGLSLIKPDEIISVEKELIS
jgi:tRNA acetyltransferase TAN1